MSSDHQSTRFFAEHDRSAAAKVAGSSLYPAEFLYHLLIEANIIQAARRHGVERLLFLGSSGYPRLRRSRSVGSHSRWSRPTSLTPSPRSPGSSCASPTTVRTEPISAA
jgi:nucleoside-diphosphate-sugar epimerase